jgi:tRNA (guanine37-N1)-methyltransferase
MTWHATILTLFPGMFPGPLGVSLAGRALEDGLWRIDTRDIREHGLGRHRAVDDTPFGGGAGMVMRPDVIGAALAAAQEPGDGRPLLYLTPRGRLLTPPAGLPGPASFCSAAATRASTSG